jgi:hypothetical protein
MTGYKDYLIILSPPETINGQVKKFKQSSFRLIGEFESLHSRAHISLKVLSRQKPFWTGPLFDQMEKELSLLEPTTLQINGFAHFLPTDYTTIYAAIKSTPEMEDWFKRLRKSLNEKKKVPYITISKQVPNALAKKLWPKFKDRPWYEQFEVNKLTILHRETYGYDNKWLKFKDIPFKGDPGLNALIDKNPDKTAIYIDGNQTTLF